MDPTSSQIRVFKDWVFGFDWWFRDFDDLPLSEVIDEMVTVLKKSTKPRDRVALDLRGGS